MTLATLIAAVPAISAMIATGALVVAAMTLTKGIIEFRRQNSIKRFEIFQKFNEKFSVEPFVNIRKLLDGDDAALAHTSAFDKLDFLGFYEEVAVAVNTGIMSREIAFYMFGAHAVTCFRSDGFWQNGMPEKDSVYYSLFRFFNNEMVEADKALNLGKLSSQRLRF